MAIVTIPEESRSLREADDVHTYLASKGIEYERASHAPVAADAPVDQLLAAYREKLDELKAREATSRPM